MADLKEARLTLESVDRLHAEFQHPLAMGMGSGSNVRSVTMDRGWWEQNDKPLVLFVTVSTDRISPVT